MLKVFPHQEDKIEEPIGEVITVPEEMRSPELTEGGAERALDTQETEIRGWEKKQNPHVLGKN